MSLPNHKYNLRSGPFGLCSGYWDEEAQVFRRADQTEEGDCCLRTCKPFVDECVQSCPAGTTKEIRESCIQTCGDIKEICEDNCQLSSNLWGERNPIYKGTNEYGCGNGSETPVKLDCMRKNKGIILKFCQKNCLPSHGVDCEEHCAYSYDMIVNKEDNPLYKAKSVKGVRGVRSVKGCKGDKGNTGLMGTPSYILYGFSIAVILLGIYILVTLKTRET
tara:strand:- start:167 stop:823 length:657 start_codon:yes stop_codon:yes gene_type:complete